MPTGRLLILDDDPAVARVLVFAAESLGFEASLAEQPQAFFEQLAAWQPTHVAIDLMMPEMSGADVLRALAARASRVRIIISSGAASQDLDDALRDARTLGLDTAGVLKKPFSLLALKVLLTGAPGLGDG